MVQAGVVFLQNTDRFNIPECNKEESKTIVLPLRKRIQKEMSCYKHVRNIIRERISVCLPKPKSEVLFEHEHL